MRAYRDRGARTDMHTNTERDVVKTGSDAVAQFPKPRAVVSHYITLYILQRGTERGMFSQAKQRLRAALMATER